MPDLTTGWEIIILGTATVFAALILLGFVVTGLHKLFGPEPSPVSKEEPQKETEGRENNGPPVAAIISAIHSYRGDGKFKIVRIYHRGEEWARRGRQDLINNRP